MDQQPNRGSFVMGLGVVFLLNFLVFVALIFALVGTADNQGHPGLLSRIVQFAGQYIGAVQILYVPPLWLRSRRKGKTSTANGMVVAACVVVLLNGICAGITR